MMTRVKPPIVVAAGAPRTKAFQARINPPYLRKVDFNHAPNLRMISASGRNKSRSSPDRIDIQDSNSILKQIDLDVGGDG